MPDKNEIENIYDLTPMQAGMLFYHLVDSKSSAYFEQAVMTFTGTPDVAVFEKAFNRLIEKYDILRTVFLHKKVKKPKQVVLKQRKAKIDFIDISTHPEPGKKAVLEQTIARDRERNFDLEKDILMRVTIIKTHPLKYKVIWSHHHIIMDGWCTSIIIADFIKILTMLREGKPPGTETAPPFGRYLQWMDRQDREVGMKYWQAYLDGYEKTAGVPSPGEAPAPGRENHRYTLEEYEYYVEEAAGAALKRIARENDVTINSLFQVMWGILLQRYNYTDDVVFGAVVSGRPPEVEEIEQMVGLFINTIPVRITSTNGETITALVKKRQAQAMQSGPYEYLSLADIQAETPLKNALLDHIMVFENYPGQENASSSPRGDTEPERENYKAPEQSNYDFNVIVEPYSPIMVKFSFNSIIYDRAWVERIARHLGQIIDRVTREPHRPVSEIGIITRPERQRVLYELNRRETEELTQTSVQQWFEGQAQRNPGKIAAAAPLEITDIFIPTACFEKNPYIIEKELGETGGTRFKLLKTQYHNSVVVNTNVLKLLNLFDGQTGLETLYTRLKGLEGQNVAFIIYAPEVTDLLEITHDFQRKAEIMNRMNYNNFLYLVKLFYRKNLIERAAVNEPGHPGEKALIPGYFDPAAGCDGDTTLENLLKLKDYTDLSPAGVLLLGDTPGMPTTGILYLAAYLRRNGVKAYSRFYDDADDYPAMKKDLEILLEKIRPGIVAISLKWFLYISRVQDLAKIVKEYSRQAGIPIKVVVGGNTASYYYQQLITGEDIDCIIRGDGELPLLKISLGEPEARIPNCVYKEKTTGETRQNPITYTNDGSNTHEVYLSHLDEIMLMGNTVPFGTFFIYTHLGCGRQCIYCGGCRQVQQEVFNREGGKVFTRPVQQVRKDIREAKPYTTTFQFDFDTAAGDPEEYCRQIWEGLDLSGHFCIISRPRKPSPALLELAVKTFKYVYWDIDVLTLSERHRKQLESSGMVKPQVTDMEIMEFLRQCDMYKNTEVRFNLIAGMPMQQPGDIESGNRFLAGIIAGYPSFSELHWARLHAQPGAPILREAEVYHMHTFAVTYDDFLEYSRKNFAPGTFHQRLEFLNYPYIYFDDEAMNSKITLDFTETNRKMLRYREGKRSRRGATQTLTYAQLEQRAERLAQLLREKGITTDHIVGIMLSPSIEIPRAILGVLKAGAAYLPIDPEFPGERIKYMLMDTNAAALVTTRELQEEKNKTIGWDGEKILLEPGNCPGRGEVSSPSPSPSPSPAPAPAPAPSPEISGNLVYVIYTSGTAGKPKGAALTHRNLVNYVRWLTRFIRLTAEDNALLTSSFAYDLGYTTLYPSLLNGVTLHIIPRQMYMGAGELLTYIRQHRVSFLKVTPSLFSVIVNAPEYSPGTGGWLRVVLLGGETIRPEDLETAHRVCPQIKIINHYGPTETAIGCAARYIDFEKFDAYKKNPTIGKPITNMYIYIVDKNGHILPGGIAGEMCISGAGVARGYLNQPQLTAEKFSTRLGGALFEKTAPPHPPHKNFLLNHSPLTTHHSTTHHSPIYKTGDLARWEPEGNIRFLGRIDKQVKIRGYRVEIGEIEQYLLKHPHIEKAVVTVRERDKASREKYLAAYFVAGEQKQETSPEKPSETQPAHWELKGEAEIRSLLSGIRERVEQRPEEIVLESSDRSVTYRQLEQTALSIAQQIEKNYDDRWSLTPAEKVRYKRQMLLDGWGTASQEKLKSTTVFVAGAGGGASPTITQLALAGVGTIIICDCDVVEMSNLNRQFLHDETRLGMNKALSAKITVNRLNPNVDVITQTEKLTRENVFQMVGDAAIIFDMFDGLESKFILSECAVAKQVPHIISAMTEISSYTAVFHWPYTPCYHCLFDRNKFDELNRIKGVIKDYQKNPLHVAASSLFTSTGFAVTEALKILMGFENPAYNKFFFFNQKASAAIAQTDGYKGMTYPFSQHFRELSLRQGFDWDKGWRGNFLEELAIGPDPGCPLCSEQGRPYREKLEDLSRKNATPSPVAVGGRPQGPQAVGLLVEQRDREYIPGILLGALKAGKALILLDPSHPREQMQKIAQESGLRLILTTSTGMELAGQLRDAVNKNIGIIRCDEPGDNTAPGEKRQAGGGGDSSPGGGGQPLHQAVSGMYNALARGETISLKENQMSPGNEGDYSLTQLRRYLSGYLPDYMIPSYFVRVETIPLTPNGKIDRNALPEPTTGIETGHYQAPRNETEEKLARVWAEILKIEKDKIGLDSNFFELGGTSLTLIELVSRLYKEFGIAVPLNQLFTSPTIRETSNNISTRQYIEEPLVLLNQKAGKNLFAFPGGNGFAIAYSNLAYLIRDYSFYSFNFIEDKENIIEEYADLIVRVQPGGPYRMFGYCAGGILAVQVAHVLEKRGLEVSEVILADSTWNREGTEEFGDDEREFIRQLEVEMERMGLDFLKDKVKQKAEKYLKYIIGLKGLEVIGAQVHYIMSERHRGLGIDAGAQWAPFIRRPLIIHSGYGEHQTMFMPGPGSMEKNAEIIKNILDKAGQQG